MVEYYTSDQKVARWSLTGDTVLCPKSKDIQTGLPLIACQHIKTGIEY